MINPLPSLFVQLVFAVKDPSTDTLEVTVFDRDMFSPNGKKWQNVLEMMGVVRLSRTDPYLSDAVIALSFAIVQ